MSELNNPKLGNNNKTNESKIASSEVKSELSTRKHNQMSGAKCIEIQKCPKKYFKEKIHQ